MAPHRPRGRERGETCIIYQQKLQYQLLFPALDLFQLHCAMPNVERRGSCGRAGNGRRMAKCALHLRICLCLSPRTSSGRMTAMLLRHVRCPKWHSRSFTANQIRQSKDPLNKLLSHEKIQLYCHWSRNVTYSIFSTCYISETQTSSLFFFWPSATPCTFLFLRSKRSL